MIKYLLPWNWLMSRDHDLDHNSAPLVTMINVIPLYNPSSESQVFEQISSPGTPGVVPIPQLINLTFFAGKKKLYCSDLTDFLHSKLAEVNESSHIHWIPGFEEKFKCK